MQRRIHFGTREYLTRAGGLHNYIKGLASGQEQIRLLPSVLERIQRDGSFVVNSQYHPFDPQEISEDDVFEFHFAQSASSLLPYVRMRQSCSIFHFHGPWSAEGRVQGNSILRSSFKRILELKVYHTFGHFIVASDAFGRLLHHKYGVQYKDIATVHPGVDTQRYSPGDSLRARRALGLPTDRPLIGCVRRLEPRMGLNNALSVMLSVPEAHLVVAGTGSLRGELENRAAALQLTRRVHFLGRVADDLLPEVYRAVDLTLVPSIALEGFGLIILESMACGTPVIGTSVGGIPEAMGPFAQEWCVRDPNDIDMFSRLIRRGIEDPPQVESLRGYAEENSLSRMAENVESAIAYWKGNA